MSKDEQARRTSGRPFTVEVDGRPWEFNISKADYDRFLREAQADANRAAHNLLLKTCSEREALAATIDEGWDLPVQIMGELSKELMPERGITLKKR